MIICYADGASRGNPGLASYGAVIYQDDVELVRLKGTLGIATNNFAEYSGVIAILEYLNEHYPLAPVLIRMDSKLVVEQLSGRWKIKSPDMAELAIRARGLIQSRDVRFEWIPREENSVADSLANLALDTPLDNEQPQALANHQPKSIRAPRQHVEPTVVYAIRHGHTQSTESGLISGSQDDPSLSDLGFEEARAVAAVLPELARRFDLELPEHVIHSTQLRATQTANAIAGALGIGTSPSDRLREISFGEWERLNMGELERELSGEITRWRGSMTHRPPGGESVADLEARVNEQLFETVRANPGKTIAFVAHMMPMRAIARTALKASSELSWSLQFQPASVSIYRFFGTEFAETFTINYCAHLPLD